MSAAGLSVELPLTALDLIPANRPHLADSVTPTRNHTTVLDLAALIVFAVLLWLHRNRDRLRQRRHRRH